MGRAYRADGEWFFGIKINECSYGFYDGKISVAIGGDIEWNCNSWDLKHMKEGSFGGMPLFNHSVFYRMYIRVAVHFWSVASSSTESNGGIECRSTKHVK